MAYATVLRLTGRGAIGALKAAQQLRDRQAERRSERYSAQAEPAGLEDAVFLSIPNLPQPMVRRAIDAGCRAPWPDRVCAPNQR